MGKFQTGNAGKPKGCSNLIGKETKEMFALLVQNNLPKLQKDLDGLTGLNRLKIILEMASYVIPKLKSIDGTIEIEKTERLPIIINFKSDAVQNR